MAGYYRQFIPGFATLAAPLTDLTKSREPFRWGSEQQEAFDALKTALTQSPILVHPDVSKPYILYTDASNKAVGAILVQKDNEGVERVISYLSHKLSGAQLNWATIEKEAYAIIYALKKFHAYLWGAKFEIHTDHKPLRSLFQSEIRSSKISRWSQQIQEFQAPILYHPGKLNIRADMLSRIAAIEPSTPTPVVVPADIPDVWVTDRIDLHDLARRQKEQFCDAYVEASQETDESPYIVQGSLLFTMAEPSRNAGRYLRLLLPQQFRQQVIDRCHAEVGHAAFLKTLARVQEHYVWPGMRQHIKDYIRHCVLCNSLSPNHPAHPRGTVPVPPAPFHTWGIDLVGPFPRDRRGRQYLLTCVDHLSGWCEAIPIASKKADTVQEAFIDNIVARYGVPRYLISDNGGEMTSSNFENWLREFGISHRLTSPYHPQCNGMTERFNGTIQKLLLKLTGGNPRKWTEYLASALYAYRITQGQAGISPYQAVFGQKPRLPRANPSSQEEGERLQAIRLAERILREYRSKQKETYRENEPSRAKRLPPGTFVSVRILNPKKGETRWQPGYQVISSHDGALRVIELDTGNVVRINQRNVREIPESKPYDEINPLPPLKNQTTFDYVSSEAKPIPVVEESYLPTRIPRGPKRPSNDQPNLTTPSVPVPAVSAALAPSIVFPSDDWSSWCDFVFHFTH
jgi:transposase InsO family protein